MMSSVMCSPLASARLTMFHGRIARRKITKPFAVVTSASSVESSASAIDTCVLSVDVGTTALKAMLLAPDGTAIASTECAYATGTTSGDSGLSGAIEQQPGEWLTSFVAASHDLLDGIDASPAGIALSGQMQNVCPVNDGQSLRSCLLYSDVRAIAEAEDIAKKLAEDGSSAEAKLANFKGAAACLCKWLWLARNDGETLRKATKLLLGAHSYVAYALCGGDTDACACDPTTASTTGLLTPPRLSGDGTVPAPTWAVESIGAFEGVDPSLLPRLVNGAAPAPIGEVSKSTADALDLPASLVGVPVFHGVGDLASTTVGAVGIGQGSGASYMYLGTSGWIARCVPWTDILSADGTDDKYAGDGVFRLLHPDPTVAIVAASMVTAGGNVEWARKTLLPDGSNTAHDLDVRATDAKAGSDGVLYLPHLNGERSPFTDPTARGCLVNLSPATTTGTMCRAVLEGVAYNYRTLSNSLGMETTGAIEEPLPIVGGGARSKLWTSTIADVLHRPIAPKSDAATVAARGCAAGAFQYLRLWDGADGDEPPGGYFPGGQDVSTDGVVAPNDVNSSVHDWNYAVWSRLHGALKGAGAGDLVR